MPETLLLREIRFNVVEPGRRTRTIDVITTLVDAEEFTKEDIAELFGFRWNVEITQAECVSRTSLYQLAA